MHNDPSGMGPEDEGNGILSKEGQQKLWDWAVNTHTVKMAKERGDRIIIDQFFRVQGEKEPFHQRTVVNEGSEDGYTFVAYQTGIIDKEGNIPYPGGRMGIERTESFRREKLEIIPLEVEHTHLPIDIDVKVEPIPRDQFLVMPPPLPEPKDVPKKVQRPIPVQPTTSKGNQPLPQPPSMKSLSSNTLIGGAIWRADMSQEGYEYMLNMVKELKGTNLGSIDITFGIPSNVNLGKVVTTGNETVNPKTGRVTVRNPMKVRELKGTGKMDVRNVEAQGDELRNELHRRLKVPVNIKFDYKSSNILFRFTPKRK